MGWEHTARERRRAPIGEYAPERYRVVVYDSFQQYRLGLAALVIHNGMSVPDFFLYAADYTLDRHPKLRRLKKIFRKGAREILKAAEAPVDAGITDPQSERDHRRQQALLRFSRWASRELHEDIIGDKL
jgi:uncharacterized protein (DUF1501 family)